MIGKEYKTYYLTCDICGNFIDGFDSFDDAVVYKQENNWKTQNIKNEWQDICPKCLK